MDPSSLKLPDPDREDAQYRSERFKHFLVGVAATLLLQALAAGAFVLLFKR